jgi:hypothetical protein
MDAVACPLWGNVPDGVFAEETGVLAAPLCGIPTGKWQKNHRGQRLAAT